MSKWKCAACGEAENCNFTCHLEVPDGTIPECCPLAPDEAEWIEVDDND